MNRPIGLQLYTVREALTQDFNGVISQIAEMGYIGGEMFGGLGITPQQSGDVVRAAGLTITSAHLPLPLGQDEQMSLEAAEALGITRIISPWMDPSRYETVDSIRKLADEFNQAQIVAEAHGLTVGLHNHWFEFEPLNGRLPINILRETLSPQTFFELDTYWIATAESDPAMMVTALGEQAPLLHIKDGPAMSRNDNMVAVGDGTLDWRGIIGAAEHAEWLLVELDRCETDMLTAVRRSYDYLTKEGLAHGNR